MPLSNPILNNNSVYKPSIIQFADYQLETLFKRVDNTKELYRAGILFIDRNLNFTELRASCRADQKSIILIERTRTSKKIVAEPPKNTGSTMSSEAINAGWSCSSTVVTWLVLIAEGAAGFETLGAAWTLMPATTASALASSAACGISVGRMFNVTTGNRHYNDWIDDDPIFSGLMIALDVVQLIDVANTVRKQSPKLLTAFRGQSKQSIVKIYTNMSSAARKELAEELLKLKSNELANAQGAIKQLLLGQRQLANVQAASKIYAKMHLDILAKSGALDIIGTAITTGGSARPGGGGAIDKLNGIAIEILVGITE